MYAVIVENDISEWEDATGSVYHFPHRYESLIPPGTKVLYYKGKIQDKTFESTRIIILVIAAAALIAALVLGIKL